MCNVSLRVDACHQHVTIHAIHLFTLVMGGIIVMGCHGRGPRMSHVGPIRTLPACPIPAATKTEQQASSLLA